MKYEIIQTSPYPNAIFEMSRGGEIIGNALRIPQKREPNNCEITFLGQNIRMTMNNHFTLDDLLPWGKPKSNQYFLFQSNKKCGELYHFHYHMLELDGCTYTSQSIDFGYAIKIPIFEGEFKKEKPTGKQIALIETTSRDQELHHYQVTALEEKEGLIALLFCIYYDVCFYNRNSIWKITCETWGETRRKELMLYDPTFKEHIAD